MVHACIQEAPKLCSSSPRLLCFFFRFLICLFAAALLYFPFSALIKFICRDLGPSGSFKEKKSTTKAELDSSFFSPRHEARNVIARTRCLFDMPCRLCKIPSPECQGNAESPGGQARPPASGHPKQKPSCHAMVPSSGPVQPFIIDFDFVQRIGPKDTGEETKGKTDNQNFSQPCIFFSESKIYIRWHGCRGES